MPGEYCQPIAALREQAMALATEQEVRALLKDARTRLELAGLHCEDFACLGAIAQEYQRLLILAEV